MPIDQLYSLFQKCSGVCTDTRKLKKDELFISLKGPNFNGNAYAAKALEAGAQYAIIDEEEFYADQQKYILVPDALKALQSLANYHRRQFAIPVIGLTGSNGKTTTKELIQAVLSKNYNVAATKGNLNNHIGVPLTLLEIGKETEIAVIEMGANHQGEIKDLSEIAEPTYGLITNIGLAHLEGFGGAEGVKKGKAELFDFIRQRGGTAFIYDGQDELTEISNGISNKISYGHSQGRIVEDDREQLTLEVDKTKIETQLVGDYNFSNVMAAFSIGTHLNIGFSEIKEAIENYIPDNNRSQTIRKGTNTIILDAYNANPSSMKAALENFNGIDAHSKMVILGDMFELGEYEEKEHKKVLLQLDEMKLEKVVLVGNAFASLESSYLQFKNVKDLTKWHNELELDNFTVLIKGSRGMKLEQLLEKTI